MIGIIDYGSGNIGAVANICKQLKVPYIVSSDLRQLAEADRYILPGVGAFDATMSHLHRTGLVDLLTEQVIGLGKAIVGLCVGMQVMAESSEEGTLPGLGWIPGKVRRIDETPLPTAPKLPHMGWNSVSIRSDSKIFHGIDPQRGFYFLHSYFFDARDEKTVVATVEYGNRFPCAVMQGNVIGLQFHPEKSHSNGVTVFRNFASI